jgi:hypothetical protein
MRELTTKSGKLVQIKESLNYPEYKALIKSIQHINWTEIMHITNGGEFQGSTLVAITDLSDAYLKSFVHVVTINGTQLTKFEDYEKELTPSDVNELVTVIAPLFMEMQNIKKN